MTQPPKGPGALPLLLRLSMLRSRQRGGGSLAERGYSLAVALIASFVLLLGAGALASRGQLGFVGQVFQVQNRQARDVAESAIADFANTMNREPNRLILVSGATDPSSIPQADWLNDSLNICTAYNSDGTTKLDASNDPIIDSPDNDVTRFLPATTTDLGNGRSFTVERVEYRTPDRVVYDRATPFTDDAGNPQNLRQNILTGASRTLVRITVVGNVDQNGRSSSARVSREFEIVPKCCKRSFGRNTNGGLNNWGRDERDCFGGGTVPGLLAGLGGADNCNQPNDCVSGSGNLKPITQEDGTTVRNASCWGGNEDGTGDPSSDCTTEPGYSIGNNNNALSFRPFVFTYNAPVYNNPNGSVPTNQITLGGDYIYFDPDIANDVSGTYASLPEEFRPSGLVRRPLSSPSATPTRLDGSSLLPAVGSETVDVCYRETSFNVSGSDKDAYNIVNCRAQNFDITGTTVLDTSSARINIFFDDPGYNGDYLSISGSTTVTRTHEFREDLGIEGENCLAGSSLADCSIQWTDVPETTPPTAVTDGDREGTFLELCSYRLPGCDDELYAVRNLLNIYASGTGTFRYSGNVTALGYNIYAPQALVRFDGGGGAQNFMGQIWTDRLRLNGNTKLFTFSSSDGKAATGFGVPLIDFIARSFTQSSGF